MEIWAHRGASAVAPENTMAAFLKARELGADALEMDVQRSSDGVLVVIHDDTVTRTTQGRGYVHAASFSWLQTLDAGYKFGDNFRGERIPRLEEVLSFVKSTDMGINLELKASPAPQPGLEQQVVDVVRQYGLTEKTVISSFSFDCLRRIKGCDPSVSIALLSSYYSPVAPGFAKQFGADAIHPNRRSVTSALQQDALRLNVKIRPYTVNERRQIQLFNAWGMDAVITNHPGMAKEALGQTRSPR